MTDTKQIKILAGILGVVLLGLAVVFIFSPEPAPAPPSEPTTTEPEPTPFARSEVLGQSVERRDISVTTYGSDAPDATHLLFVGGIHGGYEWNSVLLSYEFMDHLAANPSFVPEDMRISVIPNLNPDGVATVIGTSSRFTREDVPNPDVRVGAGRFNANNVDLNRNFDCNWAPESTWRGETVSAGTGPFSEPEAAALRDFVSAQSPSAVVFWHSQANNVYASECNNGPLPETLAIMESYATAADYGAVPSFDAYPITGDAEGWLASLGIPAITVELETPNTIEWERNLAGVEALIAEYSSADTNLAR